jgi:AcrR family transcriptional regulator
MPWTFDPVTRSDEIIAAVYDLVAEGGVAAVTYRAVGAVVGLAASSLHDNYPKRVHLLKVAAYRLARSREEYFAAGVSRQGLVAMVPEGDFDLRQAAVWLAFRGLARTEPLLGHDLTEARARELSIIGLALGRPLDDPACDAVHCLLEGLESARTVGEEPMSHERAREVLGVVMAALGAAPPDSADSDAA